MNEWKPKFIAEIPSHLLGTWMSLDGGILELCFWKDDEEAGLHLHLSQPEIREIEQYGVSDELIEWLRDTGQFETDYAPDNDTISEFEIFKITDEIVGTYLND